MLLKDLKTALPVFRLPHFSPYKVYIQSDHKRVVFLNPKVGSTAFREIVVAAMKQQGIPPARGRGWPMNSKRRYMTAPLRDYIDAFAHPQRYEFHCFVRNPYTRVISAWNDKLVKGFYAPQYPPSMRKLVPQIRRYARDNNLLGASEEAPVPFATFLSYIESQPEGKRNQHWDTQTSVLCLEKVCYTHIHQIETGMVQGVMHLLQPLGVSPDWIRQQLSRPANASGPLAAPVLNSELADRIYNLYQKDFEHFGYSRQSWENL
ncbi:sulfotransferase family 2 domain-containing protein [Kangiella sp.]|uniref:sulfotransferase family 2 domain-containing protein n=1 Tax=Kangiella sp. TaxID=1920245 RepID=UPI001995D37B|nr:sulfotransferase family 2 domain-containing protein [Kangiella sp.]MBD3654164.1 sulfotransferase family 2 domain-containing protein [Kangiella sp.]